VTVATPLLGKFLEVMSGLSGNMCVKFEVRSFNRFEATELLAFNTQKFRGSRDRGHAPFGKIFGAISI